MSALSGLISGGGGYKNSIQTSTSGTFTTDSVVEIFIIATGGGGAGATGASSTSSGGGGGTGANTVSSKFVVGAGVTVTYTVGAGAPQTPAGTGNGADGGDTIVRIGDLVLLTAHGGKGGLLNNTSYLPQDNYDFALFGGTYILGGAGGPRNNTVNGGMPIFYNDVYKDVRDVNAYVTWPFSPADGSVYDAGGPGGSSMYGRGGNANVYRGAGQAPPAGSYGAGGSGGDYNGGFSVGGAGADGRIEIFY